MANLTANQQKAMENLRKIDPDAQFFIDDNSGIFEFIMGRLSKPSSDDPESIARDFIDTWAGLLDLSPGTNQVLTLRNHEKDKDGYSHLSFAQILNGVPVFEGSTQVHLDENGCVIAYKDYRIRAAEISLDPAYSAAAATDMAIGLGGKNDSNLKTSAELMLFRDSDKKPHLAWDVGLMSERDLGAAHYFIDAHALKLLYSFSESREALSRLTYSADNQNRLPGRLVLRQEADHDDLIAKSAHAFSEEVYAYYREKFGRDSYDDKGADLVSTVHFMENYNNAYWSSYYRQMVYGDGDGERWKPLALALDIVGHELTHAVTSQTARFVYAEQAGALDEAFADIFGVFISNEGPITDWQMGEGVFTPFRDGDALRDLSNPARFGQPDHMDGFLRLETGEQPDSEKNDHGYVHFNSGIVNKMAYLLVAGGTYHGISVKGIGREKAEHVFYMALTKYLSSATLSRWTFKEARYATLNACRQLNGDSGPEYAALKNAWAAVGVGEPADDFNIIRMESSPDIPIPDADPGGIQNTIHLEKEGLVKDIAVTVLIFHEYIGDLKVVLVSPNGERVVLHDREGRSGKDISKTYDLSTTPSLQSFIGDNLNGDWVLQVTDNAKQDEGRLLAWELKLTSREAEKKSLSKEISPNQPIPDNNPAGVESRIRVENSGKLVNADITVDIQHSYIGDLKVVLETPAGISITLHDRTGNSRKDLFRTWSSKDDLDLQNLIGKNIQGDWKLTVMDLVDQDTGTLNRWALEIVYN